MKSETKDKLDKEWLGLMIRAKNMGMSAEEVRKFFRQNSKTGQLKTK